MIAWMDQGVILWDLGGGGGGGGIGDLVGTG